MNKNDHLCGKEKNIKWGGQYKLDYLNGLYLISLGPLEYFVKEDVCQRRYMSKKKYSSNVLRVKYK